MDEIDDIFKEALGSGKVDPPEEFWNDASRIILSKANKPAESTKRWRLIAFVLMATVVAMSSVMVYLISENKGLRSSGNTVASVNTTKNDASQTSINVASDSKQNNAVSTNDNKLVQSNEDNNVVIAAKTQKNNITYVSTTTYNNQGNDRITKERNSTNTSIKSENITSNDNPKQALNPTPIAINGNGASVENAAASSIPDADAHKPLASTSNDSLITSSAKAQADIPASSAVMNQTTPSQNNNPVVENSNSKFSIAAYFSPNIVNWYNYESGNMNSDISTSQLRNGETSTFSYRLGAKAEYELTKHWSVSVGVAYQVYNFKYNSEHVYYETQPDGNVGYSVVTSSGVVDCPAYSGAKPGDSLMISGTSSRAYIGIPVQLKYRINLSDKLQGYATAGGGANFSVNTLTTMHWQGAWKTGDASVHGINGMVNTYYTYIFGLGIEYKFYKAFSMYAESVVEGGITSINKNTPVISYPCSFSGALGVVYHF